MNNNQNNPNQQNQHNNQYNPNQQNQQNNQYNPNQQNQQNNQYNPNQQYQQNNQYNPNQQYQQNNQYNPNQQYKQNNQYNQNQQYQQNNQYNQYNQYNPNQQYQPNGADFFDKIKKFLLDTPVEKAQIVPQDIQENSTISLMSYLLFGLLFWLPLVSTKNSRFARFHANQSLIFLIANVIITVCSPIVYFFLNFVPIVGGIISILLPAVILGVQLGYTVLGIYNCVKGRANELPVIGRFRLVETVPVVNMNNNNVNNNNMPNNMNANFNGIAKTVVDSNAYNNTKQTQKTGSDTKEKSSATPNVSLNKNDSSNS